MSSHQRPWVAAVRATGRAPAPAPPVKDLLQKPLQDERSASVYSGRGRCSAKNPVWRYPSGQVPPGEEVGKQGGAAGALRSARGNTRKGTFQMAEDAFSGFQAGTAISVGCLAFGVSWGDHSRASEKK